MAVEKIINIVANTGQAVKDIGVLFNKLVETEKEQIALNESAEQLGDSYKGSSKEAVKSVESIGKSAEKQNGVMQKLGNSVKAVGTALKAIGIGFIIALVAKFTQALSENKTVMDTISTISTTLSIVMNQLIESFIKIFNKVSEATGGFDALGKVISGVVTFAFNNLRTVLLVLEGQFATLKLAYEKVFGDDTSIKKAEENLVRITKKIVDLQKDNVKQAKQVMDNIGEAVNEVTTAVEIVGKDGLKAIQDISVKSAYEQAKAITQAQNNFELLALQQARLQLSYQNQAELLRQIRDDDTRGISERIKANNDLAEVLNKQFQAEGATIKARISALQMEQNLLGVTKERTNEIYQLQTDLIDVEERLNGARSEQLTNANSLLREQKDLVQTVVDAENERAIKRKEFEAQQEQDALKRLEKEREAIELKIEQDNAELERKKQLYAEDTQARIDAEQEFLNSKQETDQALIVNEKAKSDELKRIAKEEADQKLAYEEALKDARVSISGQTLQLISELAGEGTALAKGVAVAQATLSGIEGVQNAYTTAQKSPITATFPAYPIVQASLAGAFSALQIKKILSTRTSGLGSSPSSSVGGGSGASVPTAPSFNLVQGTGSNQIAEGLASQNRPLKAYVVASEVSTQQSLDRNIQQGSRL
jgi:hypothetical protein